MIEGTFSLSTADLRKIKHRLPNIGNSETMRVMFWHVPDKTTLNRARGMGLKIEISDSKLGEVIIRRAR